jgi:succinate dehydrogenase / fumarate reductase membrane anchor subunit
MRESRLWFWHILSSIVILFLLGLHMGTMHLGEILHMMGIGSGDPIDASQVFERSRQAAYMVVYILLLGAGLFHGLYGLRSIFFEMSLSKGVEKTIGGILALGGIALFIYGSYVAVALFQRSGV